MVAKTHTHSHLDTGIGMVVLPKSPSFCLRGGGRWWFCPSRKALSMPGSGRERNKAGVLGREGNQPVFMVKAGGGN